MLVPPIALTQTAMPAQRQSAHNSCLGRLAARIDDPVRRLRFLKMVKPEIQNRPVRRSPSRVRLLMIPLLLAALACVFFVRAPAKARPQLSPARLAEPAVAPGPGEPCAALEGAMAACAE